jgi:Protein of unknown function (DUF2738)
LNSVKNDLKIKQDIINMESTQLITSAKKYNVKNMTFSKVQVGKVGDTGLTYKRINIGTKNEDGTEGELVFLGDSLFSYGVSENVDKATGKISGYTMPILLHGKDGASEDEKAFTDKLDEIVENCKDYLLDNKKELKMKDLERSDLRKLNPVYLKKDKEGEVVEGASPTLYAKLIVSKKDGKNKIITEFFDSVSGESYNPIDLIGKYCFVRPVIKIESLFLGSLKVSLQIKLYEAEVKLVNTGMKRLLSRPQPKAKVTSYVNTNVSNPMNDDDDENEDTEVVNAPKTKATEDDEDEMVSSIKGDSDVEVKDDDDDDVQPEPVKEVAPVKKKKVVTKRKA